MMDKRERWTEEKDGQKGKTKIERKIKKNAVKLKEG